MGGEEGEGGGGGGGGLMFTLQDESRWPSDGLRKLNFQEHGVWPLEMLSGMLFGMLWDAFRLSKLKPAH